MKSLLIFVFLFSFGLKAQILNDDARPVEPGSVEIIKTPTDLPELSPEDKAILSAGPITKKKYISGGILGSTVGFGTGHLIVGKWKESGWLYTVGEVGFLALMVGGYKKSLGDTLSTGFNGNFDGANTGLMLTGYVGFIATRIGEIFDIWARPKDHNRRYQELTNDNPLASIQIYPTIDAENLGLNFALQF